MKKKKLMYRKKGETTWWEYFDGLTSKPIENYEVDRIYIYEYKVIEVEED